MMTLTGEVDCTPMTAGARGRDRLMNDLGVRPTAILGNLMVMSGVVVRAMLILLPLNLWAKGEPRFDHVSES